MPDIALQDYGIFIGDSGKDDALRQSLQQIAQAAVQGGQVTLLDVIKIFKADTFTEAEHILERAMDEVKAQQHQEQEQQQQMMQMQAQQAQAEFEQQVQLEQVKNEAKIQVAQIQSQTDLQIADMKSDDAREISDVAHQVKNKQMFLNKKLEQDQKSEDKGAPLESNEPVSAQRKQKIQEILRKS